MKIYSKKVRVKFQRLAGDMLMKKVENPWSSGLVTFVSTSDVCYSDPSKTQFFFDVELHSAVL